jgi:hypothetical protein
VDRSRFIRPKETMTASFLPSARKVMVSEFWDAKGVLVIDYLEKDRTVTGKYHSNLITELNVKIHENRPDSL